MAEVVTSSGSVKVNEFFVASKVKSTELKLGQLIKSKIKSLVNRSKLYKR